MAHPEQMRMMVAILLLWAVARFVECNEYNYATHPFPHHSSISHHGLSYLFYLSSCPRAYDIVRERVRYYVRQDPGEAAGILRIFFHDCFVQGCDASILLERPVSEQTATSNINSLRSVSFKILDEIKASLEVVCPGTVSCADTLALAARDAVFLVGGPWIPMLTGRRDTRFAASDKAVMENLPSPLQSFTSLKRAFNSKGLTVRDLVALSGAHTIGETHCRIVDFQLIPSVSPDLNPTFAANLSNICLPQTPRSGLTVHMDELTPDRFDNAYFKNVLAGKAVFHSDAALLEDTEARYLVETFANSEAEFFKQFSVSMMRMSQLGVLTGEAGEVRSNCIIAN